MKIFSLIQLRYDQFERSIRDYISKSLGALGVSFSNASVFGQLINVVSSTTQNILSYIEDGMTEHNKYTAARKRSIYSLAEIGGYFPSLGTATTAVINLTFIPNNTNTISVILPNKTKVRCLQNGAIYNIVLPQEAIVLSPNRDNISKYLSIVEGVFETQEFIANGGSLYTENIKFNGDADIEYTEVYVNDVKWERRASLYDMDPEANQYLIRTSLDKGFDVIFGTGQNGKMIEDGDSVRIVYLTHTGEYGNIDPNQPCEFEFVDNLTDISGDEISPNQLFHITIQGRENINGGTNSETTSSVRQMIGLNSRSLVLADPKNYKQFFNKFSFVGYNRTWSEVGSLIINSLIIKNYQSNVSTGKEYFNLTESDFKLSDTQKNSLINSIAGSGQQLAGAVVNIFDPEIVKYAIYIYIKPINTTYDTDYMTAQIKTLLGEFFCNVTSDIFIPKSDIIKLIKEKVDGVDGVDVYFLSQLNEQALINKQYVNKTYEYNPSTGTYKINQETIYLYDGENPGVGLDAHGNIYLANADQFPVLMGGWQFISSAAGDPIQYTTVNDPVTIIFE